MIDCRFCKNFESVFDLCTTTTPMPENTTLPENVFPNVELDQDKGSVTVTYMDESFTTHWPLWRKAQLERLLEWITQE
jgi:hypothetical protein